MKLNVACPAKVNLSLVVLPPDPSGYHPIRTVFQAIGLYDRLTIEPGSATTSITAHGINLPPENTLSKTLRLVHEAIAVPPLNIELHKAIPPESGLGGGSSDAAGLLLALDRFLINPLPAHLKFEIAVSVGADVPFFLVGGRAYAEGYGERLTALPDPDESWFVLARPDAGVSTAKAYAELDMQTFARLEGAPIGHNDFESVAPPESMHLIDRLKQLGAGMAMLSGSGSAVFGQFESEAAARRAEAVLRAERVLWFAVAPSLPRSAKLIEEL